MLDALQQYLQALSAVGVCFLLANRRDDVAFTCGMTSDGSTWLEILSRGKRVNHLVSPLEYEFANCPEANAESNFRNALEELSLKIEG